MAGKKIKVLILGGGPSSEHDISLKTAGMVAAHLDAKKYEAVQETVPKTGDWFPKQKADVVFIAMHGEFGEDGKVQGLLELAGLTYTGSGVVASSLGMDKLRSQMIFAGGGLNVPGTIDLKTKFELPVVIKPADRGSSVGVSIVRRKEDIEPAILKASAVSQNIMAQEFIEGVEMTCGVLDDGKNNLTPLLPTEIVPVLGAFFDYESKYKESGSEEITPARVPDEVIKEAQDIALRAHVLLGCRDFSRTDMIWDKKRNKIYTLEINTIPGLTAQSLLPKAAAVCGISFSKLLDRIIKSAIARNK